MFGTAHSVPRGLRQEDHKSVPISSVPPSSCATNTDLRRRRTSRVAPRSAESRRKHGRNSRPSSCPPFVVSWRRRAGGEGLPQQRRHAAGHNRGARETHQASAFVDMPWVQLQRELREEHVVLLLRSFGRSHRPILPSKPGANRRRKKNPHPPKRRLLKSCPMESPLSSTPCSRGCRQPQRNWDVQ